MGRKYDIKREESKRDNQSSKRWKDGNQLKKGDFT